MSELQEIEYQLRRLRNRLSLIEKFELEELLKEGISFYLDYQHSVFLIPIKFSHRFVHYREELWELKRPIKFEGYLKITLDPEGDVALFQLLDKNLEDMKTAHSIGQGKVCLMLNEWPKIEGNEDLVVFRDTVSKALETINMNSLGWDFTDDLHNLLINFSLNPKKYAKRCGGVWDTETLEWELQGDPEYEEEEEDEDTGY